MIEKVKYYDFLRILHEQGLTYSQAKKAYKGLIAAMENALIDRQAISFGHLGTLVPAIQAPRNFTLGCRRIKGREIDPNHYQYSVGSRVKFRFRLGKKFGMKHGFL